MDNSTFGIYLAAARPKTLWAAVAPVMVGTAMAFEAGNWHAPSALLALAGALLIQTGVNFHNDYADYLKGSDTENRKGPLRVTQAGLVSPRSMRRATILVFALAVAAGAYLMWRGGWPVVLIGAASIACAYLYTGGKYSLAYLGLGDVFVLLFFGPGAVGGTYYVQALDINWLIILAGLGPGLLAAAILQVNNIRDVDEDRQAEKRTLVVRLGRANGVRIYTLCVSAAAFLPWLIVALTGGHAWILFAAVIIAPAYAINKRLGEERTAARLNPLLGKTALLLLLWSLLFSLGWNL